MPSPVSEVNIPTLAKPGRCESMPLKPSNSPIIPHTMLSSHVHQNTMLHMPSIIDARA